MAEVYKQVHAHRDFKKLAFATQHVFKVLARSQGMGSANQERENNRWVRELWTGLYLAQGQFAREIAEAATRTPPTQQPKPKAKPRPKQPHELFDLSPAPSSSKRRARYHDDDDSDFESDYDSEMSDDDDRKRRPPPAPRKPRAPSQNTRMPKGPPPLRRQTADNYDFPAPNRRR
jgi:hypothetical protein